ncbi:hypothetical protein [Pseudemcibacter aquimaris]|uniref:hypothetical protein n=1 Tax=Pseudemcibacter aquimaris TaxID=2857064 RepID=UPI0020121409|nr:hypothetical protein [Pseudemcibacter aquimaris]MCC3861089.1 hypothetical protein [Pseudemcibacter aquimaris]WDU59907.1 hypothetical protein KW060_06515 [Pseudemcibacter aquimaris]
MFSKEEILLIKGCLNEAVNGEYFDDEEFQTIFGFYRDEINDYMNNWSGEYFDARDLTFIRVTLNQLLGYPHGKKDTLEKNLNCKISIIHELKEKVSQLHDPGFIYR